MSMLTVEEALKAVIEHAKPLPPVRRSLDQALGLILAEDAVADRDQPPFDKALMDGYAVRSEDFRNGPISFRVVEEITAGKTPTRDLGFGEAASIMTGAPMPQGADAVIMFERARAVGDSVVSDEPVSSGQNRLAQGAEIRAGEAALPSGSLLEPVRIGVLASIGRAEVPVVPRPRVRPRHVDKQVHIAQSWPGQTDICIHAEFGALRQDQAMHRALTMPGQREAFRLWHTLA